MIMDTPICDFVRRYAQSGALRLHMPGHKGTPLLGMEQLDITEIAGADSLYEANSIIARSEQNASVLFDCPTYYSTEGASQCIRAMIYLAMLHAKAQGKQPVIAAARNVHKTFLSAAALMDVPVHWIYAAGQASYLSCPLTAQAVEAAIVQASACAVYVTSPDYLGNMQDIAGLSQICHRHGVLLLVDNAHGAYLRFLQPSLHPVDLGADLCCDSAHKTLPVLTGGAYLHIGKAATGLFTQQAKNALALFGSTSPSYLTLQSLDRANLYLEQEYPDQLAAFLPAVQALKDQLTQHGYQLSGKEPLKITLQTKPYGYTGMEFADLLYEQNMVCEFADPDHCVLMVSPQTGADGLAALGRVLLAIAPRQPIADLPPAFSPCQPVMTPRQALFSVCRTVPVEDCVGKVLASASVGCPPAVPIVICGERIDGRAVACFQYYGIRHCSVVEEA